MVLCRHRGSPKSSASEPSLCAALGVARQLLLFLPDGGLPPLGLFQSQEDRDGKHRGGQADQEHHPPGAADRSRFLQLAQRNAHQSRKHVAESGKGLQPAQGERTRAVGHDLGHERHAHGELAAHTQAGQEAIESEIPDANRQAPKAR